APPSPAQASPNAATTTNGSRRRRRLTLRTADAGPGAARSARPRPDTTGTNTAARIVQSFSLLPAPLAPPRERHDVPRERRHLEPEQRARQFVPHFFPFPAPQNRHDNETEWPSPRHDSPAPSGPRSPRAES